MRLSCNLGWLLLVRFWVHNKGMSTRMIVLRVLLGLVIGFGLFQLFVLLSERSGYSAQRPWLMGCFIALMVISLVRSNWVYFRKRRSRT